MVSTIAKKLIGIFIADDVRPVPSLVAWTQEECRSGGLREVVDDFIAEQSEPLEANLLLVEKVDESGITCRIPCKVFDHESPHAFRTDVWLKLDPTKRSAVRLAC